MTYQKVLENRLREQNKKFDEAIYLIMERVNELKYPGCDEALLENIKAIDELEWALNLFSDYYEED